MTTQPPPTTHPLTALSLDRRSLFRAGVLGAGLAAAPFAAAASTMRGFTHGVASGEPGPAQVLLWTRYVGDASATLRYEVSETTDFGRVVSGGNVDALPERDGCV
ncbi:MAG: PhoD-like phosphatase N-terminal domain-containing protein, partial [Allopontixanthobacter sediminis]